MIGKSNNDLSISCLRLDDIFRGDRSSSSDCTLSQLRLFTLEQLVVFSCSRLSESVVVTSILNGVGGGIIPISCVIVSDLQVRSGVPILVISILSGDSKTFCGNELLLMLADDIESIESWEGNSILKSVMVALLSSAEPEMEHGRKNNRQNQNKIITHSAYYESSNNDSYIHVQQLCFLALQCWRLYLAPVYI